MENSLSLSDVIDEHIRMQRQLDKRHVGFDTNTYFASSAGHCLYSSQLDRIIHRQPTAVQQRRFEIGNILHDYIQTIICKKYPEAEKEKGVAFDYENLKIKGWADISLFSLGIEIKTITDISEVQSAPFVHNVQQSQIYMYGLKKSRWILLYVQKSDMKTKEHSVHFNKSLFQRSMNDFMVLNWCESRGIQAPRSVGPECAFCLYTDECLNEMALLDIYTKYGGRR